MKRSSQRSHEPTVKHREVAGLILCEEHIPPGAFAHLHWHERPWFSFVLDGSYTETRDGVTRECPPAAVLFHPGDYSHSCWQQSGVRLFNIEVAPRWLEIAGEYSVVLDEPVLYRGGPPVGLAARLHHEFCEADGASALAIEGLALQFLAEASRRPPPAPERRRPQWLKQAEDLLADRFTENLTSEEIAATVGVHPVHLARVFRQYYSCSPGDYVRRLRLETATRELCASDTPLIEIALGAGYCDQSHFSKAFKHRTGMSPARFRQSCHPR